MVSVIIPVYNGVRTIGEQLDALRGQDYSDDWEIIVVNNCSTDNTVNLIQTYQQSMPHLRLVHALQKRNRAYARNVGTQAAHGDVFLFCDADDVVAPGWVSAMVKGLENHDLAAGRLEVGRLNSSSNWKRSEVPNGAKQPILGFLPYVVSANLGVSRRAFESVHGFSEVFTRSQDVDFTWRLQIHGYFIKDIPEAIVYYRYRDTFWQSFKQTVKFADAHVLLYKHFACYGMPRSPVKEAGQRYLWLAKKAKCLLGRSPQAKMKWLYQFELSWGRLLGSIRYRTLYL